MTNKILPQNDHISNICDDITYEYKNCKKVSSKFYNYYETGEFGSCALLKNLVADCFDVNKTFNKDAIKRIINYDETIIEERKEALKDNDVWKYREIPPSDWNAKLPDWCQEQIKNSLWNNLNKENDNKK